MDFPDESFDAVTSNYVYHNISGINRQELLLETLRLVKRVALLRFMIFSQGKYGDMRSFIKELEEMGYENIQLIDTTDGLFMTKKEAAQYSLKCSAIFCGESDAVRETYKRPSEKRGIYEEKTANRFRNFCL